MTELDEKMKVCDSEIETLSGKQMEEIEKKNGLEEAVKEVNKEVRA